ncbi:aldehyde dehydrogenase [Beijerinckia sp. L45]|uniref:aldehyde dehydrogenase n=1 Tax=Beijerinckia sp. L45 TaxID=1641855 RepID=UPI001FEF56F9|nr:aldehyde dehydrogenase [Beijerinckia sp. L45]
MHQNFIGGRFVDGPSNDPIVVLNPATGRQISTTPDTGADIVDEAVAAAKAAQPAWAKLPAIQRANHLRRLASAIRDKTDLIARTISEEQGKLLGLAKVEVAFTADYMDYMAEWARRIEGEIIPSDRAGESIFLFRQPIGVVGGILPWNFPFFLIARKLAPALVTGNTIVIKPSEETPNNAALFADIVAASDLPAGVFNLVYGRGGTTGAALVRNPDVGMLTFTGSVRAGSAIMAAAAPNITKLSLELGGKAPAIVMADADLDLAARAIRDSRVLNNGQVCNCAERVYVQDKVANDFAQRLTKLMAEVSFGDPLGNAEVGMGPLINRAAMDKVESMVRVAVSDGAELLTGGHADGSHGGAYFQPTVLMNCRNDMAIMRDEIFGPVLPIDVFHDFDEAVAKANDSEFGLTSSIYTKDLTLAMRACQEIRFGETYINRENFEAMQGYHAGVRKSGIGGADGKHGVYEFTQTHVVYIQS